MPAQPPPNDLPPHPPNDLSQRQQHDPSQQPLQPHLTTTDSDIKNALTHLLASQYALLHRLERVETTGLEVQSQLLNKVTSTSSEDISQRLTTLEDRSTSQQPSVTRVTVCENRLEAVEKELGRFAGIEKAMGRVAEVCDELADRVEGCEISMDWVLAGRPPLDVEEEEHQKESEAEESDEFEVVEKEEDAVEKSNEGVDKGGRAAVKDGNKPASTKVPSTSKLQSPDQRQRGHFYFHTEPNVSSTGHGYKGMIRKSLCPVPYSGNKQPITKTNASPIGQQPQRPLQSPLDIRHDVIPSSTGQIGCKELADKSSDGAYSGIKQPIVNTDSASESQSKGKKPEQNALDNEFTSDGPITHRCSPDEDILMWLANTRNKTHSSDTHNQHEGQNESGKVQTTNKAAKAALWQRDTGPVSGINERLASSGLWSKYKASSAVSDKKDTLKSTVPVTATAPAPVSSVVPVSAPSAPKANPEVKARTAPNSLTTPYPTKTTVQNPPKLKIYQEYSPFPRPPSPASLTTPLSSLVASLNASIVNFSTAHLTQSLPKSQIPTHPSPLFAENFVHNHSSLFSSHADTPDRKHLYTSLLSHFISSKTLSRNFFEQFNHHLAKPYAQQLSQLSKTSPSSSSTSSVDHVRNLSTMAVEMVRAKNLRIFLMKKGVVLAEQMAGDVWRLIPPGHGRVPRMALNELVTMSFETKIRMVTSPSIFEIEFPEVGEVFDAEKHELIKTSGGGKEGGREIFRVKMSLWPEVVEIKKSRNGKGVEKLEEKRICRAGVWLENQDEKDSLDGP